MNAPVVKLAIFLVVCVTCCAFKLSFAPLHRSVRLNPFRTCRALPSVATPVAESTTKSGAQSVLKCDGLSKSYTGVPQFESISLNLAKGQRVGLIGVNGAGKSTLLKCLSGVDTADSGTIEKASGTNVIYVDQEPAWGDIVVYEALFAGDNLAATSNRKYFALMKDEQSMDVEAFSKVTDSMETSNGWEYQERGLNIASKLNIPEPFLYRKVTSLSGGERKRVGLSAALLKQPDVLLLDEPTNHLDVDALEWLAEFLRPGNRENKDLTMLLVTHDRFFLEKVCSEIVELDRAELHRYPGNYARYLELKAARIAALGAETDRARTKLRKEAEWMSRQPRARQAKSKSREGQFYELVEKAKGRVDSKQMELATAEEKEKQKRLGGIVAEFRGAQYDMAMPDRNRTLLQDFTYNFRQRDRIGIVGPNGVGKSTFLKVLTGLLPLSNGTVRLGENTRIGYYEQTGLNISAEQENDNILRFVTQAVDKRGSDTRIEIGKEPSPQMEVEAGGALGRRKTLAGKEAGANVQLTTGGGDQESAAFSEKEARKLLTRFQFPANRWQDRVRLLSGGERRRLQLLQVLAAAPNVLLLDEPSNDLDLSTLTALEEYLVESFQGCLVVVSHDNFFVNRVAEHLFVFQGDGVVRDFQGSYTEYLEYRRDAMGKKSLFKDEDEEEDDGGEERGARSDDVEVRTSVSTDRSAAHTSSASSEGDRSKTAPSAVEEEYPTKPNLSYEERKELNKLEREISKMKIQVTALNEKMAEAYGSGKDRAAGNALSSELKVLMNSHEEKEQRWKRLKARMNN